MTAIRPGIRKFLLPAAGIFLSISLLMALLSLALPSLISSDFDGRSLASLERQARAVEKSFSAILRSVESRKEFFEKSAVPDDMSALLDLFKQSISDSDTEGVALTDGDGNMELWLGRVLELREFVTAESIKTLEERSAPFLIKDKSSVFLVRLQSLPNGRRLLAHFKLLAFIPQFQSRFVLESHAFGRVFKTNFDIDYGDFREDVSGFEKLFDRHADRYAGQPQRMNEIQTLFFPLRNNEGRILATVTLSSPSLISKLTSVREIFYLLIGIGLLAAGVLAILHLWISPAFIREGKPAPGLAIIALMAALRLMFFPLSRMESINSRPLFSPSSAGFMSFGSLTQSPADIFLTSLLAFAVAACLAVYGKNLFLNRRKKAGTVLSSAVAAAAGGFGAGGLLVIRAFAGKIVANSNVSLLRWSMEGTFLLLHLSLLLLTFAALVLVAFAIRLAFNLSGNDIRTGLLLLCAGGAVLVAAGTASSPFLTVLSLAGLAGGAAAVRKGGPARRETVFLGLLFISIFLARTIDVQTAHRTRVLIETTLRQTIVSQENWGKLLVEQSFQALDRSERDIRAFLRNPLDQGFAHALWETTPVAKFNWYSSLEIRDAEGDLLSRFSLNVPGIYGSPPELRPARTWSVVRRALTFIGKEKEFLIGYRDWFEGDRLLGRVVLSVSLDPEILPFLYSANPYFEVLRTNPLPALNQFDFGCAVYDLEGNPLFNPEKITAAVPAPDIERLRTTGRPAWTVFQERGKEYDAFLFVETGKLFRLFTPRKKLKTQAVEFLRIFFFHLALVTTVLVAATLVAGKARLERPFHSFSNRVYAAFLVSALLPLLLFTVFTRNLFDRIFTDRFVEDAAVHAGFARSLLEDFLIIQDMELSPYLDPSEDLVLWISSTLSNDVNLYSGPVHLASSRREFFDSGLLPDLLDGETYFNLLYGKKPYDTQRTRIGEYSFQTLTVPYPFEGTDLFISLPFPFEKEETDRATGGIVEFLILLSSLFFLLIFLFSRAIRAMIIVPVRKLLAGTREVSLGNLEVTIQHRARDEMMTLIDGFNAMTRDLKTREQDLAEMSKKVAWTEMARKVAHEVKNPLTPIQLSAEHTLKVYEDGKADFGKTLKESMSYIIGEVEHLRNIAQDFMEIARDTSLRKDPLDIRDLLAETLAPYMKLLSERIRITLAVEGDGFRTAGDEAKLKTAFRNVVANAVEAIGGEGAIAVKVRRDAEGLTVSIRDDGPGIPPETLKRIFDPYFSTKESGTGLGLPISKKIIEDHGGTIRCTSDPGAGTTVTMVLPG